MENPKFEDLQKAKQTLLDDAAEVYFLQKFNLPVKDMSNLALVFSDFVSPVTIRAAHERFFAFRGLIASRRKYEDLMLFKSTQDASHFYVSDYMKYVAPVVTSFNSIYISDHFQRNLKLTLGKIPVFIATVGVPGIFASFFTHTMGMNHFAWHGLPDCLYCHAGTAAVSIGLMSSIWPLISAAYLGIHFSHLTSTKEVPVDLYTSKTAFLKALKLAKDIALRGKLLPVIAVSSSLISIATFYGIQKQVEEFITLFSLVCHAIENPQFPTAHRKPLFDPKKILLPS